MQRHSQTEIAVLGGLSVAPMTGYGLRSMISETLGHFWRESFGQIYPTLARLERAGLVRREAHGRTSGSVFEITDNGLIHLRKLLAEPISDSPPRNGLLLRLFFGRLLDRGECETLLRTALEDAERAVTLYASIRSVMEGDETNANFPFFVMTVAAGQHHAKAQAAWAREALDILSRVQ